jgi:uncharacterized protein YoxC
MEIVLYIAASIALLALAGLFVYLIVFLNSTKDLIGNLTKTVNSIIEEVKTIRMSLQGTIQNVQEITEKAKGTVDQVNQSLARVNGQLDQVEGIMGQVEGIVGSVKQMTDDMSQVVNDGTDVIHAARNVVISVIDLEQDIQLKVQQPIVESMTIFSALGKGIRAFKHKLAGNGNGHVTTDVYYK